MRLAMLVFHVSLQVVIATGSVQTERTFYFLFPVDRLHVSISVVASSEFGITFATGNCFFFFASLVLGLVICALLVLTFLVTFRHGNKLFLKKKLLLTMRILFYHLLNCQLRFSIVCTLS